MRIVHVYNQLDPANGGPPRVIAGLAAALAERGHTVAFVSRDPPESPRLDAFLSQYFQVLPPRLHAPPPFLGTLRTALAGADVAHLHGIWPVITLAAAGVCRARGIPYVLAPHGSLHRGALHEKRLKKWVGLYGLGFGAMVRGAAALHVLNAEEADGAPRWLRPSRVEVIANGIFAHHFAEAPPPGSFRRTVPGLGDAPYVLFLSRLHPAKGCDLLATAFGSVAQARPDVHLVVAGGDQGGAALFEDGARRHGYTDRLHLVGELGGVRKDAAVCDAALFCLPSHHEGFSMAITEALAWGRPVVISEQCHFPAVAEVGAGHVVRLDAAEIASKIMELLSDPAAAEAMGTRGRAMVFERYRWESIGTQVEALYRSVRACAE